MRKDKWTAGRIAYLGMFTAVAMILSYLESLIPVGAAIPGIKLGLANLATIVVMYRLGIPDAVMVSLTRVVLSSLLFGNMAVMAYSLAGAACSLLVMSICKRTDFFGVTGASILGGVSHNAGQLAAAALLSGSRSVFAYMPVLVISGTIAGVCVGVAAAATIKKLPER